VRLLVGTDEEKGANDVEAYAKTYPLPDLALVLDSDFPVVVGEKAWAEWLLSAPERPGGQGPGPVEVVDLVAGQSTSIVPDRATLTLRWRAGTPDWDRWLAPVLAVRLPPGTTLEVQGSGAQRTLVAHGRAAHAGTSLAQGRNALVALAIAVDRRLPTSAAADLLGYAKQAGQDTEGTGLGLTERDPLWGGVDTNVARVIREGTGPLTLVINLRSPPPLWGEALKKRIDANAQAFASAHGTRFESGGQFIFPPYVIPADSPLVTRLLASYARATGVQRGPVVSAGGTYAQRLKNAVPFGMWFREDGPYPGHAADEQNPLASLTRGAHALAEALGDLATSPPIEHPLQPAAKPGTR
jgi:succinyl-diaminopimelate desuccinylase